MRPRTARELPGSSVPTFLAYVELWDCYLLNVPDPAETRVGLPGRSGTLTACRQVGRRGSTRRRFARHTVRYLLDSDHLQWLGTDSVPVARRIPLPLPRIRLFRKGGQTRCCCHGCSFVGVAKTWLPGMLFVGCTPVPSAPS
jgi:hypothetical protein